LAAMAASTKYILAAVAASKKIEYKNVEKIFIFNFFEEAAKFKRTRFTKIYLQVFIKRYFQ